MELNPNHPTTQAVSNHWHKIAAILMQRLNVDHVVITVEDVNKLAGGGVSITIDDQPDGIHLRLVDEQIAVQMARKAGGLPV